MSEERPCRELSQDDIDEINMCFSDCKNSTDHARECCKRVGTGITFKKFLFSTLPGNIILVLIAYTMIQMILNI